MCWSSSMDHCCDCNGPAMCMAVPRGSQHPSRMNSEWGTWGSNSSAFPSIVGNGMQCHCQKARAALGLRRNITVTAELRTASQRTDVQFPAWQGSHQKWRDAWNEPLPCGCLAEAGGRAWVDVWERSKTGKRVEKRRMWLMGLCLRGMSNVLWSPTVYPHQGWVISCILLPSRRELCISVQCSAQHLLPFEIKRLIRIDWIVRHTTGRCRKVLWISYVLAEWRLFSLVNHAGITGTQEKLWKCWLLAKQGMLRKIECFLPPQLLFQHRQQACYSLTWAWKTEFWFWCCSGCDLQELGAPLVAGHYLYGFDTWAVVVRSTERNNPKCSYGHHVQHLYWVLVA